MATEASAPSIAPVRRPRGGTVRVGGAIERWLEAERDQLALWLPVGLGCGVAAWFVLLRPADWIAFAAGSLGLSLLGWALGQGGRAGRAIAWFALAAALGCAVTWWRAERVAAPRLARVTVTQVTGRIERIEPLPARDMVRLRIATEGGTLPPRVRINVDERNVPAGLAAGAQVSARARLLPPAGPAIPGAYDFARVAWFQGIGATGRALDPVVQIAPVRRGGWGVWLAEARRRLTTHITGAIGGGAGGIAAALVTGDTGAIPDEDAEAMRRSGLAHLLSISGLHVTAVIGATMVLILKLLALSPRLALRWPLPLIAAGGGALAGIAYTLLSGSEVPTVRSVVAALLVLGGLALGREAVTLRLVATGALIVLLLWPEALVGPSFQLSFAAVTTIVALHEQPWLRMAFLRRDEPFHRRLGRNLLSLLITGIAVEAALAPIGLYHFQRAGLYGALANIVAIPLTTFVIMPLEALALLLDAAGLGLPFWWLAGQALDGLLWVAHTVAALPGATAALPSMPAGAFALMIAGGLWLLLWRTRMRLAGLLPFAAGALWAAATPAPDLLVTGDGRHLAVRGPDGVALLRVRAGDYVRDMVAQALGAEAATMAIDDLAAVRCSADLCAARVAGRTVLATRSAYLVDAGALIAACRSADVVVSERRLPKGCHPRWLRIDRPVLAQTGGVAIGFDDGRVRTVNDAGDRHPWRRALAPARSRPYLDRQSNSERRP